jgi:hypothetical protein
MHINRAAFPYLTVLLSVLLLPCPPATGQQGPALFEDFSSAEGWEDFYFPKIKEHTSYSLGEEEGVTFLVANSSASASAYMLKREINVYETPVLGWRWKVGNVYEKGDLRTRKGDDSPLRVYVMFEYDPRRATAGMRLKYAIAKALYGEYPPHASLNYIWASRAPSGSVLDNAYTERSRMVVKRSGTAETGRWLEEEADILRDYRRAFGQEPPEKARIAVMNDSDNTGESALSYIDYIMISAPSISNGSGQ